MVIINPLTAYVIRLIYVSLKYRLYYIFSILRRLKSIKIRIIEVRKLICLFLLFDLDSIRL